MTTPDPKSIAKALDGHDRAALLALANGAWGKVPSLSATTNLLFGYAIPLIVVNGDWAKQTRVGAAVCRELTEAAS